MGSAGPIAETRFMIVFKDNFASGLPCRSSPRANSRSFSRRTTSITISQYRRRMAADAVCHA